MMPLLVVMIHQEDNSGDYVAVKINLRTSGANPPGVILCLVRGLIDCHILKSVIPTGAICHILNSVIPTGAKRSGGTCCSTLQQPNAFATNP
jgi:hypothetical protein